MPAAAAAAASHLNSQVEINEHIVLYNPKKAIIINVGFFLEILALSRLPYILRYFVQKHSKHTFLFTLFFYFYNSSVYLES